MKWLALSATMANLLLSMAVPAASQDAKSSFPNRPIHIVTPIAAGGNMDCRSGFSRKGWPRFWASR